MIVDTHAHMNSPDFKKDFDAVMARAAKEKVGAVVNIGFDLASSQETLALTKRYEQFYGAVGVHPHDASTYNEAIEKELGQMAADAKMLAIGEIGLDYYRDLSPRDLQDQAFRAQLRMAKRLDMPIVIHCRDAFDDVLSVLVDEGPAWRGIFHAFSGDLADADRVLELGFHIGIGGIVTFKNSGLAATVSRLRKDRAQRVALYRLGAIVEQDDRVTGDEQRQDHLLVFLAAGALRHGRRVAACGDARDAVGQQALSAAHGRRGEGVHGRRAQRRSDQGRQHSGDGNRAVGIALKREIAEKVSK